MPIRRLTYQRKDYYLRPWVTDTDLLIESENVMNNIKNRVGEQKKTLFTFVIQASRIEGE